MKKAKISIRDFLYRHMVLIAVVNFGLLLLVWIFGEYSYFLSRSRQLRDDHVNTQKAQLVSHVNNVVDYINYMKSQTEGRLRSELRGRVHEAAAIAENICRENRLSKSANAIEKMVKDALRPIRFLNGRGYYFAFSMDGIETLFADRPEMEGVNMLPIRGAKGEYVVRDMIDIVERQQEGFYEYTWTKPAHEGRHFPKIAFVKYVPSLDWTIGTGEYLDDFTAQIQAAVLERVVAMRFGDEGYFFGSASGGYPLFTDGKITRGTDPIWEMTDPNGVKIIQEQQEAARQPGGGFVEYVWHKLGSQDPSPKIAYVRNIPDWEWTVGAGVYLDTVEGIIANNERELQRELVAKIVASSCVFIGLVSLLWFWAKHLSGHTQKSFKTIEAFFQKAATEDVTLPADDMPFQELSYIAASANEMIEDRKRFEQALKDSERRFRELFDNMSAGVAIYDSPDDGEHFVFRDLNRAGLENTQKRKSEVVGREVREVFPGVAELGLFDVFKRVWMTGVPENHPSSVYRDDEIELWVENYVYRLPTGELVAIYEDTTARMRAEKALRENEKFLETIVENIPDMIFVKDAGELRFVRFNKAGEELIGYSRDEMLGKNDYDFFPRTEADFFTRKDREVLERHVVMDIPEEPIQTRHKGERVLHTKKIPILNESGAPVYLLGISEDITGYKQLQAQLWQTQKLESIGMLAGGIAHDFNNILFPIVGMAELLLEDLPAGSTEHENVYEILRAGKRGSDLVKQILAFSRQSEHHKMPTRIQQVLAEVLNLSRSTIPSDIEISQDIQTDCGLVMANPTQIHQVAMNLITNAYHAIGQSKGKIAVRLGATALQGEDLAGTPLIAGNYAVLKVSDNGCGIDPGILDKIFEPYFSTKEMGKGTGLGLAVVYGIVREHGGDIRVDSAPGEGSAFTVYFPLLSRTPAPPSAIEEEPVMTGSERILLVDDEAAIVNLGKQLLERIGYRVTALSNSVDALDAFKTNPHGFDLLVTDMAMPDMTGDQLAREFLSIRPDFPVIICTGFSERIDPESARAIGIKGFLMKPIVRSEMARVVRTVLDETQKT